MMDAEIIAKVRPYTKAPVARSQAMIDCLRDLDARAIAGDVVECGVWRGGQIMLARIVSPQRKVWLYDTFDGMTEPGAADTKMNGEPAATRYFSKLRNGMKMSLATLPEVQHNLRSNGMLDDSLCRFIVGDVCKTLNNADNVPDQIALLRLDTDFYSSTKKELEILYPRLANGGVLLVDDYGHWRGCRQACQRYFKAQNIRYHEKLKPVDYTCVMMIK